MLTVYDERQIIILNKQGFFSCVYWWQFIQKISSIPSNVMFTLWVNTASDLPLIVPSPPSSCFYIPSRATLISPGLSRPCVPRLYLPVMFCSAWLVHHNGCLCLLSSLWPSPSPREALSLFLSPSWAGSCLSASLINTKTNCSRLEVCSVGRSC